MKLIVYFFPFFSFTATAGTFYEDLNLNPKSSYQEIQESFNRWKIEVFPTYDQNDPDAMMEASQFQRMYEILTNEELKINYDQWLATGKYSEEAQTPYEELGISPKASDEEIKTAFRAKAKKVHPDLNPNDPEAGDKFNTIKAYKNVLLNPLLRRNLDIWIASGKYTEERAEQNESPEESFSANSSSSNSSQQSSKNAHSAHSQTTFNNNNNQELHRAILMETHWSRSTYYASSQWRQKHEKAVSKMVNVIITNGVDINARNGWGATALILAIVRDYQTVIKQLLKAEIDVSIPDDYERNYPVHHAILMETHWSRSTYYASSQWRQKHEKVIIEILNLLFLKKAHLDVKNGDGKYPLQLAIEEGFLQVALSIIKLGGTDYLTDQERQYITGLAIEKAMIKVVEKIQKKGNIHSFSAQTQNKKPAKKSFIDQCLKAFARYAK